MRREDRDVPLAVRLVRDGVIGTDRRCASNIRVPVPVSPTWRSPWTGRIEECHEAIMPTKTLRCELDRGHNGDHRSGDFSWKFRP